MCIAYTVQQYTVNTFQLLRNIDLVALMNNWGNEVSAVSFIFAFCHSLVLVQSHLSSELIHYVPEP